jgi:TPR repeat protein
MRIRFFVVFALTCPDAFCGNSFIKYYVSKWLEKYPEVVLKYLKRSSDVYATYILGLLYLDGIGVQRNLSRAEMYINVAVEAELPCALNLAGDCLYSGTFGRKDQKGALRLYRRAADLGFGPGQFNAGVIMFKDSEGEGNLAEAVRYLRMASRNDEDLGELTKRALLYKRAAEIKLRHLPG